MADALTPRQVVAELDKHIVGQHAAKKAVAVAIRNRWRRQQLPDELRKDITPKNIILIGPTGVGKTEIARRLATLVGAPFVKVEATKFTEVGYVGRDVESMVRDLVEVAVGLVKQTQREKVKEKAAERVTDRLLDLLVCRRRRAAPWEPEGEKEEDEKRQRTREKFREKLLAGELEERVVEIRVEQKQPSVQILGGLGMEQMEANLQDMFERIIPKGGHGPRTDDARPKEARKVLLEQETEAAHRPGGGERAGGGTGREPGDHLPRRDRQGVQPARGGQRRGGGVPAGGAARPAAGGRGHHREHQARAR